jgi:hypothetical protein
MSVRSLLLVTLCLPALSACVVEPGGTGAQPRSIADQCVSRAASALKVKRAEITVSQALSLPEGDLVTLQVPGTGTVRCMADVDGVIGPLEKLAGPPAASAPV